MRGNEATPFGCNCNQMNVTHYHTRNVLDTKRILMLCKVPCDDPLQSPTEPCA